MSLINYLIYLPTNENTETGMTIYLTDFTIN